MSGQESGTLSSTDVRIEHCPLSVSGQKTNIVLCRCQDRKAERCLPSVLGQENLTMSSAGVRTGRNCSLPDSGQKINIVLSWCQSSKAEHEFPAGVRIGKPNRHGPLKCRLRSSKLNFSLKRFQGVAGRENRQRRITVDEKRWRRDRKRNGGRGRNH